MTKPDTITPPAVPVAAPVPAPPAREPHLGLVFAVVSAGFVMSNLDMMIVNVAFPAIEHDFAGSTAASLSWTLNAYSIIFAALLVPAGRLADRASRKAGFLLGLGIFTLASVLCATATGEPMLVASRALQAVGAAALVPTSLGLLLAAFPAERRQAAVRAWTAVGGVSAALAPIIGGVLVNANWRWIFLINLPIGLAAVLVGRRVLPDARTGSRGPLPDLFGSLLLILGVGALALGLVKAPDWGWGSARVLGSVAAAAVLVVAFLVRSARHPSPVVSFELLRIPSFRLANLASLVFATCFAAMLLSLMLWTQNVWGYSALRTGLALAPGTFLMPVVAMRSGRLVARIGAPAVIALGCAILAGGVGWWAAFADVHPHYLVMLLPGAIMTPVGSILALTTLIGVVTRDLPPAAFATGSAINTMIRQVGFVIGVSAFVAAVGSPHGLDAVKAGFQRGWLVSAGFGVLAVLLALALLVRRREPAEAG